MNKSIFKSLLLCTFFATQATEAQKPTFRQFMHNNAGVISSVISLGVMTALYRNTDNAVIKSCSELSMFFLTYFILLHPGSYETIETNLATPTQMLLHRACKLAILTYCFNSFHIKSKSGDYTKIIATLGLIRNTFGLPIDIYRIFKTI